jgi:UDP-N-acetylglucosamine--N-acetylmuramyl-(pentapeptide) pyrophosphoryl-undecaprenol N-acetylglucosamine transferase
MKRSRKIIAFTGGGSGGHVFPAFGVIDELDAAKVADYRLVWIGSRRGVEGDMVRHRGIDFFGISAGKLRRYLSLRNLADAVRFLSGILEALFLMLRLRPAILFSKGGLCVGSSGHRGGSAGHTGGFP